MKKILVSPLNWGLGHATRCIPIINKLINPGTEVSIAGDGGSLKLLQHEFPQLPFFELPTYDISYGSGNTMVFKMVSNYPKIRKAIAREHEVLKEIQKQNHFDVIISDNRYGMWHEETCNVFITHQINIQVPKHLKWLQPLLLNYNLKQISNFNECWIPDKEGEENLSGDLSHNCKLPNNSYYIGMLSRFGSREFDAGNWNLEVGESKLEIGKANTANIQLPASNFDLLIVLSGPEPQRTIFENIILQQLNQVSVSVLIVRGLTGKFEEQQVSEKVRTVSYLTSEKLRLQIQVAPLIVCRSGYSSIMDLVASGKRGVLVPTPGQTEQEYLAQKFHNGGIYYSVDQSDFKLIDVIEKSKTFKALQWTNNEKVLEERIEKIIEINPLQKLNY